MSVTTVIDYLVVQNAPISYLKYLYEFQIGRPETLFRLVPPIGGGFLFSFET